MALSLLVPEVGETWGRVFVGAFVLLVLTSMLPPFLRRLEGPAAPAAAELLEVADRIELLTADPGNRTPEIRAELKRLRALAQGFES